ncbi:MAG: multiheme c-type cytochrome [Deltaproteobacteria bacterium]
MSCTLFAAATIVACANTTDGLSPGDVRDAGHRDAGRLDGGGLPDDGGVHAAITLPAAVDVTAGAFTTSGACATCHASSPDADAMRDDSDRPIAPYDLWQSSMMANAARDPLFRAVMSAELAATPGAADAINAKCLGCHAPMARRTTSGVALADLYTDSTTSRLALDGVSCTVCHQIEPDGLGTEATFSGGFPIAGDDTIYGPHAAPFARPMEMHTGYSPVRGDHVLDSALCGSCHTLYTDAVDEAGNAVGARLPEQTPYLEWRASAYATEGQTCQDCHAPKTDVDGRPIATRIARNPGGFDFGPIGDREPYGRHVFVGANTLVPALLKGATDLGVRAPSAAFDATIAQAKAQIASAATVQVELRRAGDTLEAAVRVVNQTGHKLPTAHPIRRMWLRVRVSDADATTVFASGQVDAQLRLVDASGAPLPFEIPGGPVAPHVNRVTDAATPAVYESVMADARGAPTTLLLRGASYKKDNRILPRGWRVDAPEAADIAPVGVVNDADFEAGSDTVTYVVEAPAAAGPYRVTAELLYTSLSPRWYAELRRWDTREVADFVRRFEANGPVLETIATVESSE